MRAVLAYIDPATGTTIAQLVLAGVVGMGVLLKLQWHRFKAMFTRSTDEQAPADSVPDSVE